MIEVKILINGVEVESISAVNITEQLGGKYKVGEQFYETNYHKFIVNSPFGSAVKLAIRMLSILEEFPVKKKTKNSISFSKKPE